MNDWNLNNFFNLFNNLFDLNYWNLFDNFYCFYLFLNDNFLNNNLYLSKFSYNISDFNNFLDDLWYFYDSFDGLNDWNRFLNYSFNNFMSHLNVILNLSCGSILDLWDNLFFNFDNLYNLWNVNDFFNNFFHNYWYLDNLFNNFFK